MSEWTTRPRRSYRYRSSDRAASSPRLHSPFPAENFSIQSIMAVAPTPEPLPGKSCRGQPSSSSVVVLEPQVSIRNAQSNCPHDCRLLPLPGPRSRPRPGPVGAMRPPWFEHPEHRRESQEGQRDRRREEQCGHVFAARGPGLERFAVATYGAHRPVGEQPRPACRAGG